MAKAKSKATIMVADGFGGMMPVQDRRFEPPFDWPIRFEVAREQADTWLQYFSVECERRGWSSGGIGQLEAKENSGSITVNTGAAGQPQLVVVWERKRGGPIKVRARSAGTSDFPLAQAQELFEQVNQRCLAGATERFYRRGQLSYNGLAWRGEIWLSDALRLGPPTKQDEAALVGPRIILIDALVDCAGQSDAAYAFDQKLRELSAFLTVVIGISVGLPAHGRAWTFTVGAADCAVRNLGYFQDEHPQQMPVRGACSPIPLKQVDRPDFSLRGIDGSTNEQSLPSDISDLWAIFCKLMPDKRRHFLQAAAKWQEALLHWGERSTLSFALMVIACEALKPSEPQFRNHNIYHVVESLLGNPIADRLQKEWFRSQDVRNAHLHRGEFRGSEFVRFMAISSYKDPTFDQACRALAEITQAAIIEWLRRGGTFTMPPLQRRKTLLRLVKEHILAALVVGTTVGFTVGLVSGWLIRRLWHS